jgi:flagellar hook-length control protein FliK
MNNLDNLCTVQQHPPAQQKQEYKTPRADRYERTDLSRREEDENRIDRNRRGADIQANFLDFVLAQSNANDIVAETQPVIVTPTIDVVRETPQIDSVGLIDATPALTPEVIQFIENTELGDNVELSEALALNKAALNDILNQAGIETDILTIEGEEIPEELSALLNLNLTPAQLAALQEARKDGESNDTLKQILSGIVTIIVPEDKDQQNTLNAALAAQLAAEDARLANEAATQNIDPAQLNIVPKTPEHADTFIAKPQNDMTRSNSLNVGWGENGAQEQQVLKYLNSNFKAALKDALEQNIQGGGKDISGPTAIAGTTAGGGQNAANLSGFTLQNWPQPIDGLLASQDSAQMFSQELGPVAAGTPNASQMAGLTSLIGQSQGATHAHPATKMVAVNMQKAAGKGGDTQLTIQLDPPELGRVEVRMHFSKDKSVQTTLMIEKPETHVMMQRDAQTLERAMQEMGLDTDGGINFELAEQGFDFEQDNQRGGGHDKGGTGAGGEQSEDLELIETTMTWQVDEETGHMRYNIWA